MRRKRSSREKHEINQSGPLGNDAAVSITTDSANDLQSLKTTTQIEQNPEDENTAQKAWEDEGGTLHQEKEIEDAKIKTQAQALDIEDKIEEAVEHQVKEEDIKSQTPTSPDTFFDNFDQHDDLQDLFLGDDAGTSAIEQLLSSGDVTQIVVNQYNKIIFTDHRGTHISAKGFSSPEAYLKWINSTLLLTNLKSKHVLQQDRVSAGIFTGSRKGSIHIAPTSITGSEPAIIIKRWPTSTATLDQLQSGGVLSTDIRILLETSVRGRTGILITGSAAVGKSAMLRALALIIEPTSRVVSVERLPEINLATYLPNTVALTAAENLNLGPLLQDAISMRPDRLIAASLDRSSWEPLIKYSTAGGTGLIAQIPALSAQLAIETGLDALCSAGYGLEHAAELIATSFGLVVHLHKGLQGRRVVQSVSEIQREGAVLKLIPLHTFDIAENVFKNIAEPSLQLQDGWTGWGVSRTVAAAKIKL